MARTVTSVLALASLAACSAGMQGGATSGFAGPLSLAIQTGPTTVTALNPNLCELDLDFGSVPLGALERAVIQVKNTGTSSFELSPVDGVLDPEFSLLDPTGEPIPPGAVGTITVSFDPDMSGTVTSSFTFPTSEVNPSCPASAGATGSILTVQVTGAGLVPCLALNPTTLDFGSTEINTPTTRRVTLQNGCGAPVSGIVSALSGGDSNLFWVESPPSTLQPDDSVILDLSYEPLALKTRSVATLAFVGSGGESATAHLFGEPLAVALTLDPDPIDFGFVPLTTTAAACTTVSNQANVPVDITGISGFSNDGGAFAVANAEDPQGFPRTPITIAGAASAQVCFTFTPSIGQQYSGQVTLVTDDPSGTNPIVQLTGWSGGPRIACSPTRLDFGPIVVGESSTLEVICTNTGTANPGMDLVIDAPTVSPFVFSAELDPTTDPDPSDGLAPGLHAKIDVSYGPTALSSDTGMLVIQSNDSQGRTLTIPLTGQGTN